MSLYHESITMPTRKELLQRQRFLEDEGQTGAKPRHRSARPPFHQPEENGAFFK